MPTYLISHYKLIRRAFYQIKVNALTPEPCLFTTDVYDVIGDVQPYVAPLWRGRYLWPAGKCVGVCGGGVRVGRTQSTCLGSMLVNG